MWGTLIVTLGALPLKLCTNLASGLATSVTMELATGLSVPGLTTVTSITTELAGGVNVEEPEFTFADRSQI